MTKASVLEVRAFAERMVKYYTTSTAELMSLAQTPPPPEDAEVKAAAKAGLETQTDATFDRAYIAQAVTDHGATVTLYEQEAGEGKDERLKLWASQKLPVIREHLEAARALGARLSSSAVR
jgi:putative membrane protein